MKPRAKIEAEIKKLERVLTRLKNSLTLGCTCGDHVHSGTYGCSYGGRLGIPACKCKAHEGD